MRIKTNVKELSLLYGGQQPDAESMRQIREAIMRLERGLRSSHGESDQASKDVDDERSSNESLLLR